MYGFMNFVMEALSNTLSLLLYVSVLCGDDLADQPRILTTAEERDVNAFCAAYFCQNLAFCVLGKVAYTTIIHCATQTTVAQVRLLPFLLSPDLQLEALG